MKTFRSMAIGVSLLVVAGIAGCGKSGSEGGASSGLGTIRVKQGVVTIERGSEAPLTVKAGESQSVHAGDRVKTDAKGEATLLYTSQIHLMKGGTEMVVGEARNAAPDRDPSSVRVIEGTLMFFLPKEQAKTHKFQAVSNSVLAAVEGTIFQMGVSGGATTVSGFEHDVSVYRVPADAKDPISTQGLEKLGKVGPNQRLVATAETASPSAVPAAEQQAMIKDQMAVAAESKNFETRTY